MDRLLAGKSDRLPGMADEKDYKFKNLGSNKTDYGYDTPAIEILETFPSPFDSDLSSSVEIVAPEFTTLCPITGQPDFATIVINYIPKKLCVESKSLKLYFVAFRNHKGFHEETVNRIAKDLIKLLDPKWIKVEGQFTPRGGIKFWPVVEYPKK